MNVDFDILQLETPAGLRSALVITPTGRHVVEPRPYVASADPMSDADRQILEGGRRAAAASASVCIFRARAPVGEGYYGFAPTTTDGQAVQTALSMLEGQMRVYRGMLDLGICLFLHTDLGGLEVHGFRGAVEARIAEIEPLSKGDTLAAKRAHLDLWMLRNLIFFFSLGFDKLAATVLPEKLTLMEKRMERIRRLAGELKAASG
ncbi:MAG: hypothetical protein ACE37F_08730 [Nannocystaceae bacterium]|nr:hypothetical protein [bacterium]